jgi:hypothetical protein
MMPQYGSRLSIETDHEPRGSVWHKDAKSY